MAEIKWIKITTDIFDDEKIKIIDTMPARDEILVIWFKLLALSGKVNQSGLLFMNSKIAYTPEMLSAIFNRELNSVRLALTTFENFGMITIEENEVISIANWEKHQNIDGMDKIREDNRLRQQKHRAKQKALTNSNVTSNVTVTENNAIEEDKEEDKKKKKNKKEPTSLDIALNDFKKMRKAIKSPLTTRAETMLINKLDKMADTENEKIAILEQSIFNSWKGVFELKDEPHSKQKPKERELRPDEIDFIPEWKRKEMEENGTLNT